MRIAEVLINRPSKQLDRLFSYIIPDNLNHIGPGWRVIIPFSGRWEEGIILAVGNDVPNVQLKEIFATVGEERWFSEDMLAFADHISEYYLCTRLEALRLFLLEKKGIKIEPRYQITKKGENNLSIPLDTVSKQFESENYWRSIFPDFDNALKNEFLIAGSIALPKYISPKETWLSAVDSIDENSLNRKPRQQELYFLLRKKGMMSETQLKSLGFSLQLQNEAFHNEFVQRTEKNRPTESYILPSEPQHFVLTEEQKVALQAIINAQQNKSNDVFLLHGVTGSGKTEVYIRAAYHALKHGKSVLILVPEIMMTNQMVARMSGHFGNKVVYIHSALTKNERYNNWQRIKNKESRVIIGARSALFMPFSDLGLIVIDEEYDQSYKQEESPGYHACYLAEWLGQHYSCPVVRGGATPSIQTYYRAEQNEIKRLVLSKRVGNIPLPNIKVVDMRNEIEIGNRSILSRDLYSLIEKVLSEHKQIILLLNRRGYSTYIFCRSCGYVMNCESCERPLTYHLDNRRLLCHHCEQVYEVPIICPQCGSKYIKFYGMGTQRAVKLIQAAFPIAKIARLDRDVMGKIKEAENILTGFYAGKIDILIGTQLVAKGHDIPNVASVGILSVDSALQIPDYTASEQVFNLVTQAAGRAGRKDTQGQVILQTYHPDHHAIAAAVDNDYARFYHEEIELRKILNYPPFVQMMRVTTFDLNCNRAAKRIQSLYDDLINAFWSMKNIYITEPYEAYFRKIRNKYYFSFDIKTPDMEIVKEHIRNNAKWRINGIIIDIDVV